MASFHYRYSPTNPPSPSLYLNVIHPNTGQQVEDVPTLVDTGADQTILPQGILHGLGLPELDRETIHGFDGTPQDCYTYLVVLQVRDFPPFEIEVLGSAMISDALVGRDVLNRFKILLDGPQLRMTISDEP